MKYIIIGLGNFGSSLAVEFSSHGNEVIGVDIDEHKVVDVKDRIASAIQLDATEYMPLKMLPIHDVDVVIIAIGENFGASVQIVAMLKKEKVKRIYARALSSIHKVILESLNVDKILSPEYDAANALAQSMEFENFVSSYHVDNDYYAMKFEITPKFQGYTVEKIGLNENFNLNLVAVSTTNVETNLFGIEKVKTKIIEGDIVGYKLQKGDMLTVFGKSDDFHKLWKAMS